MRMAGSCQQVGGFSGGKSMTSTINGAEQLPGAESSPGAQPVASQARLQPRFLEGKLQIPEPHFPVLRRRRITSLIDQAIRNRVTLICGPAGAGKTVACATWAAASAQARRVVWLTVDSEDQQSWF